MLHIASAHSGSPRWLAIQRRALAEHLKLPYTRWGSLTLVDSQHPADFDRTVEQKGPEAGKLNHLATEICHEAPDEDLLMFLAPDAFPIADPLPTIERALAEAPLLAVRRGENDDDPQPHPCFCVTTVGAWKRLAGDWSDGCPWTAPGIGRVTDLGANLLRRLELTGTPWVGLERTGGTALDPLRFGVYGGIVYFHNATEIGRVHRLTAPRPLAAAGLPPLAGVLGRVEERRRFVWERNQLRRARRDSEELFSAIADGGTDWLARVGQTRAASAPAG